MTANELISQLTRLVEKHGGDHEVCWRDRSHGDMVYFDGILAVLEEYPVTRGDGVGWEQRKYFKLLL